jgi:hypothetical protein
MNINMGLNKIWRIARYFLWTDGNMLIVYLPDLPNVIFFPLFRHLPLETEQSFSSELLSCLTAPRSYKLTPQSGHYFINGIAHWQRLNWKCHLFRVLGHHKRWNENLFCKWRIISKYYIYSRYGCILSTYLTCNNIWLLVHVYGVRLCLWTVATNGPIVHPPGDTWVWRVMVECC